MLQVIFLALSALFLPTQALAAGDFDPCQAGGNGILSTGCSDTTFGFILGQLINFIFVVAVILALGFLVYGGIRWVTSGGDKGAVEGARNMIIAALVGLLVIVLSYFLLNYLVLPFLGLRGGFQDLQITPINGSTSSGGSSSQWCGTNNPTVSCYCVRTEIVNGQRICIDQSDPRRI